MKKSTLIILIVIVVLMAALPLVLMKDAEFEGADGAAEDVIAEIDESYEPWFEPLVGELPGEVESMLFALQAAIGALGIGYYFGRRSQKSSTKA